jgi:hypothetical protein
MKRALGWMMALGMGAALATGCGSRQDHPSDFNREDANRAGGPYLFGQPQQVPRERRPAPLGVGGGMDSARKMAQDQLKSY